MNFIDFIFTWKNVLFRKDACKQYKESINNEKKNIQFIKSLNWEKRKAFVHYAYENIPFYKSFYNKVSFHPSMLSQESDWDKIPILEKKHIKEHLEDILNPHTPKRFIGTTSTGGSTGIPLKIYTDKRFHTEILGWRAFKWWGVSPAANVGIIHRRVPTQFIPKLKNRLLWWPTKRAYLNASYITDDDLNKFANEIIDKKIVWLQGYVGGLERLANYIIDNNIKITTLKLVWSTSAPLFIHIRKKLELAFNCKIMNQYGCCEVGNIAIQCPYSENLHINYDYVHVDIINSNNQSVIDEEGDILITNLESHAFPLIKYRLGDRGTILSQTCSCGNSLPLIKTIKGRISDAIYTPAGEFVDGNYLTTLFDEYPEYFNQFQIYQKSDYSIIIRINPITNDNKTQLVISNIKANLEYKINHSLPITIEIVDRINDDQGKIRYIISEIALKKYKETINQ